MRAPVAQRGAAAGSTSFRAFPEPRSIGRISAGHRLLAGEFTVDGKLLQADGASPWTLPSSRPETRDALQDFAWLDDLAAVGSAEARAVSQAWLREWILRYSRGTGPGWRPELAGRRMIRWAHHGQFLLHGMDDDAASDFFDTLHGHAQYLAARATKAQPGLSRFQALTGLAYSGVWLEGMEQHLDAALAGLAEECDARIDAGGGIASRNPEELTEVLLLLTWVTLALTDIGREPPAALAAAVLRIAPTLRSLRHADGCLARFHGGGACEGRVEQALGGTRMRPSARGETAMGFARLSAGRTTLIVDAAPPPAGADSRRAHASTLAFELTSARRPLIVSCGPGTAFGPQWGRAARATSAHSNLTIEGFSSSRLGSAGRSQGGSDEELAERPADVALTREGASKDDAILVSHDGYAASHGLVHLRRLQLAPDGRSLFGEDVVGPLNPAQRVRLLSVLRGLAGGGVAVSVRFHLHPDVQAALAPGGRSVSLLLRSGETWIFRAEGAPIALAPSVYFDERLPAPRQTRQIILSARLGEPAGGQINWTLAKAQDTPAGIRDFDFDTEAGPD